MGETQLIEDEDMNNNQNLRAVPEREATTSMQVSNLLNIAQTMMGALLVPNHGFEPHHEKPELDGGCKNACEAVLIETCNVLTDVLRDKTRWNLLLQRALESQALQINAQHIEVLKAQRAAVASMLTPSYRFKPSLARLSDGYYAAYLGDITQPEHALIGIGKTAEAAFAAFDELFSGRVPNDMVDYLLAQEEKLKLKLNEKQQTLDETRTSSPSRRKTGRRKPRNDS